MKAQMGRERKTLWRQVDNTTTMRHDEHKQGGDIHLGLPPQADRFPRAAPGCAQGSDSPAEGAQGLGVLAASTQVTFHPGGRRLPEATKPRLPATGMVVHHSLARALGDQGRVVHAQE